MLVVIGAYLAAHVAFEWLGRRFLLVSGAEYLLLGILVGPQVSGLIQTDVMGGFAPFMTLALGWIGTVVGAQFFLPALARLEGGHFRIALLEAVFTLALVTGVMVYLLAALSGSAALEVLLPAVALGAVATASAPSGIALVTRRMGRDNPRARQLEVTTAVDAAVAVVAFGLLLSLVHETPRVLPRAPTPAEWALISVGIGVVGGALFHLFLGGERKVDRLFVALAGAVILASGAAAYLRLSPLLPALIIGAMLANTLGNRGEFREVLGRVERPLYFVLLIFAGAAWRPGAGGWLVPVAVFLMVRGGAKVAGGALAAALERALPALGAGWGRALLGQGGLAIAIGLNYRLLETAPLADLVFTAAIVSVLLTDVTSARFAGAVLQPGHPAAGGGRLGSAGSASAPADIRPETAAAGREPESGPDVRRATGREGG